VITSPFSRVLHYLKGPNPLHPDVVSGRLSPITFRRFVPGDLEQCLELYRLNEPGRFPGGYIETYKQSLLGGRSYYLVAERNGVIVASGGMNYSTRADMAVFCFGLVHPERQGHGLGTALLLSRLALLKTDGYGKHVFILALAKSISFYRRFGFGDFQPWQDPEGRTHPSGHLYCTSSEVRQCRRLLKRH